MSEHAVRNKFFVMTSDTNDLCPLIYGGALWGEMDKTAAIVVRSYLKDTPAPTGVTHHAEVTFKMPSYRGDVLTIDADVESAHEKSIVVKITVTRDKDLIAEGKFVFISIHNLGLIKEKPKMLQYCRHGKPLEKDSA